MPERNAENNRVSVIGVVVSGFEFSHEVFGESFYIMELSVNRLSDQSDTIPVMISERLIDINQDYRGRTMEAIGQFRSYNRHEGTRNRLVLSVFVREYHFMEHYRFIRRQIRSCLTDTSVNRRCIERHRLDVRSQIFW